VEPIALREAIAHRDPAWEEQIVLANHRLSRINRSSSADHFTPNTEWDAAHRAFHHALIAACPSRWLIDFCNLLSDHATRYRNLSMAVAYPAREVVTEHSLIMNAAIAGDAELAVARLVEHYRRTEDIIIRSNTMAPATARAEHRRTRGKPRQQRPAER
jgi:GntR family transcriptional regulator, carbon starvation induced regulator